MSLIALFVLIFRSFVRAPFHTAACGIRARIRVAAELVYGDTMSAFLVCTGIGVTASCAIAALQGRVSGVPMLPIAIGFVAWFAIPALGYAYFAWRKPVLLRATVTYTKRVLAQRASHGL